MQGRPFETNVLRNAALRVWDLGELVAKLGNEGKGYHDGLPAGLIPDRISS